MAGDAGRRASAWLFGPAIAWGLCCVAGLVFTLVDTGAWSAVKRSRSTAEGSERCRSCHAREHETWSRSYHRTMTQEAKGDAVLAPFAGESLDALGFRATMTTTAQGRPHVKIVRLDAPPSEDVVVLDVDVEFTVGSHRYQQYVARIDRGGGTLERFRLPVAWHVALGRWIHINDAFLTPQGQWGDREDYLRHLSRWNDNCIFCHNTEPVPGLDEQGQFDTRTAELGIACEACHGAGSAHVRRHASPLRRVLALGPAGQDASVAHPGTMSAGLHADVCGRCHGNRIAADIAAVMREGDGFVPGHPLSEVSRPIVRDATLGGQPGQPFAPRFWPDGTPRLSAYEYQALRASPCHLDGEGLGCGDCHTMHGEEPAMQLRADYSSSTVCSTCHAPASLSDASAAGGHGRHDGAVSCEGCHLPRVTYGLLEGMMSHRITRPAPESLRARDDMPDACTQCHVDRSREWAADALVAGAGGAEPSVDSDAPSRVVLDLHGGDPIQRALAAHALARPETPVAAELRMAWLVDALADDYPAIRWFGYRGLRAVAQRSGADEVLVMLEDSSVMDDAGLRALLIDRLRARLGPGPLAHDPTLQNALQARRDDRAIWIGE